MHNFKYETTLNAPVCVVYSALTSESGLRAWWTEDCNAGNTEGAQIAVRFNSTFKTMVIERMIPESEINWHVLDSFLDVPDLKTKDEWIGSTICMRLNEESATRTHFALEHIGLTPDIECYALCSGGWSHFLDSLKEYVETGKGKPFQATVRT